MPCVLIQKNSAMRAGPLKHKSIHFATIIDYSACKIYNLHVDPEVRKELIEAGYELHHDECPPPSPPPVVHRTKVAPAI